MRNVLLAVVTISFALSASSRRVPAQTQRSPSGIAASHPSSGPDENVRHFEGVIVSKHGQPLVLRDDANNIRYHLTWHHPDDQQAAGKYLGKKVLVTGTLDAATDVIRVQKIEETN